MIAVITVWMMELAVNQIVNMIAVGNRLVTATGAVPVPAPVGAALLLGGAASRILGSYRDHVFVNVITMHVV